MAQALGVIAVGLLCLYFYATVQALSAERLAKQVGEQVKQEREQVTNLVKAPGRSASKALEAEVARLQTEVSAREASLHALDSGELGNTAGFSEYFAAFGRQVVPGVWLTAIAISDAGNQVRVQGRALRPELMSTFLNALGNESIMQGRHVTELKLTGHSASAESATAALSGEPKTFVEFSVSAPLQVADDAGGGPGATQ
ncbi:MAG: PilN domain-containing protein [Burkholderiales bacterium]